MSTAIMSPITTPISVPPPVSELSRSSATYYVRSKSSLPRPTLPFWSLERSRTTFRVAAAVKHPRSSSSTLIDDDPDRDEENHIRGIKRKKHNTITTASALKTTAILLSPAATSSSKRRCYPTMMVLPFSSKSGDSGIDRPRGSPTSFSNNNHGANLLPPKLSSRMTVRLSSLSPDFSSSMKPAPSYYVSKPTTTGSDRFRLEREGGSPDREGPTDLARTKTIFRSCSDAKNESEDDEHDEWNRSANPSIPKPPEFRRHGTIRDGFDLACSIDEFAHSLIPSSSR